MGSVLGSAEQTYWVFATDIYDISHRNTLSLDQNDIAKCFTTPLHIFVSPHFLLKDYTTMEVVVEK